jgi:hypothetical protein
VADETVVTTATTAAGHPGHDPFCLTANHELDGAVFSRHSHSNSPEILKIKSVRPPAETDKLRGLCIIPSPSQVGIPNLRQSHLSRCLAMCRGSDCHQRCSRRSGKSQKASFRLKFTSISQDVLGLGPFSRVASRFPIPGFSQVGKDMGNPPPEKSELRLGNTHPPSTPPKGASWGG